MLIGHFGVALGLKRLAPRTNLAWLAIASLFIDLLLWVLILAGVEHLIIPADLAQQHYFGFEFPYSHSLLSTLVYAVCFGILGALFAHHFSRIAAALILAFAVLSHWLLDFLVHPPQIPVAGESSMKVGLGLWNTLPIAHGIELAIFLIGLLIYYRSSRSRSKTGKYGPFILFTLIAAISLIGQAVSSGPVDAMIVAASSLAMLVIVIILAGWFDTMRVHLSN